MKSKDSANSAFPCDSCGLCCKNIKGIEALKTFHDGDGICKYLKDNICSIYKTRPIECQVEAYYEKFIDKKIPKQKFYDMNTEFCEKLKSDFEKIQEKSSENLNSKSFR